MTGVEPDGACPWCGWRAHPFVLVRHTWRHVVPRKATPWDYAGLLVMTGATVGLIAYAVVAAVTGG